jgi:redox-sensitive bicupin YhaK (pirin superfamily)
MMLRKIDHEALATSDLGWLLSRFHFSFAEYHDPGRMQFGALRVLNDDLVAPGSGFDLHPHSDFEILSYVVDGRLTHADSMGNTHTLSRGEVQYMSAGTGVWHSEHNHDDETLRFLQVWIFPDAKGHEPAYGDHRFRWDERDGRWLHVAAGDGSAPVVVHQDVHISVAEIRAGRELALPVAAGRQAYLLQVEGSSSINGVELDERDALEIVEEDIVVTAVTTSHMFVTEMALAGR